MARALDLSIRVPKACMGWAVWAMEWAAWAMAGMVAKKTAKPQQRLRRTIT